MSETTRHLYADRWNVGEEHPAGTDKRGGCPPRLRSPECDVTSARSVSWLAESSPHSPASDAGVGAIYPSLTDCDVDHVRRTLGEVFGTG